MNIKTSATVVGIWLLAVLATGQNQTAPRDLTVNLLSGTEKVYLHGYPVALSLEEALPANEPYRFTEIGTLAPFFGWVVPQTGDKTNQSAYRLLVASRKEFLLNDSADLWDTGKIETEQSLNVVYRGKPLSTNKTYFWKVKTWNTEGEESEFSAISAFKTANALSEYQTDRHPVQKQDDYPLTVDKNERGHYFADFGRAAFGRIRLRLYSDTGQDTVTVHLGEARVGKNVNRKPGGTIRYSQYRIPLERGLHTYLVAIRPDKRNTGPQAVPVPDHIGEVTPFRYCEIENYRHPLQLQNLVRESAFYPFNEYDSDFHSSDTTLNRVWEISKYSIKATSFTGVYIDGDRERIPYEADALINQLSHYCVAKEYNMARYTHEYLINRPTWPTEWILQSVLIAWNDYLYTGNTASLARFYEDLKAKTLSSLADEKGFISTRTGKMTPEVMKSIHFDGQLRDIVDWPHTGILGLEKQEGGETDGYVFTDVNTVVNAFHYRALTLMAQIAEALDNEADRTFYSKRAALLKQSFNKYLFDKNRGVYLDGIGTGHASLHANMFPLAFGLVPDNQKERVVEFIRSRGMACSVYGAQFLLDALYDAGAADYALQLLTSTGERSWYNMIRVGSTITLEAWDNKYKPNQDWNHAWGAAPANLIPRKLMGIEPLEPGFRRVTIKPRPATLKSASVKHPTLRGDITASFVNDPGHSFRLEISLPPNSSAKVFLPYFSKRQTVSVNGTPTKVKKEGDFFVIDNVDAGKWTFETKL